MKTIDWTRDELVAYILLFAANADFKDTIKERKKILSKVDKITFQDIYDEFDRDNDYQGTKKIMTSLEQHGYDKEDADVILEDIKVLFFSEKEFGILEDTMLQFLETLLRK